MRGVRGVAPGREAPHLRARAAGSFIEAPAYERAAGMLADEPDAAVAGQIIEHYRIFAPLGKGGMGEVYLADDTRLNRPVALKLLSAHFATDEEHERRFRQEAYAASALNHPNISRFMRSASGMAGTIVTEFIDGITLRERIRRGKLSITDALEIALQATDALAAAHAAGIIHRDLKPENIMLRREGYLDPGLWDREVRRASLRPQCKGIARRD